LCDVPGRITLPQGQSPWLVSVFATLAGDREAHVMPFRFPVSAPFGSIWSFGEEITMYAESADPVLINVVRNNAGGAGFFNWALSGYFLDA